ncbi:hypothetical protein MUG84_15975 [Paenibacillus sp. KQZ6P-2]|uniref:Uncharacterized protein n=1 Tax=Paenibacillus mangrovi TaxID=2931978 RepID=A0A9X2B347_9BACL|nr:hypothetical protein [Paenibacillus mangrovi]
MDVPGRFDIMHPHLTNKGKIQAEQLKALFDLCNDDLSIASPTVRTIETLGILTEDLTYSKKYITPLVGPRMFPQNPEWTTLICDFLLSIESVEQHYPNLILRIESIRSSGRKALTKSMEDILKSWATGCWIGSRIRVIAERFS